MFDEARADEWPRSGISPSISADWIQMSVQVRSTWPMLVGC